MSGREAGAARRGGAGSSGGGGDGLGQASGAGAGPDRPRLVDDLLRYCDLLGPSGQEDLVARAFAEDMRSLGLEPEVDAFANVTVRLGPARGDRPTVAVTAHLDEIGFVVRKVEPNGFLRVHRVGGVHDRVIAGQRLVFLTDEGLVSGVVGVKAKHLSSQDELSRSVGVDDAYVDVFAGSREEALRRGLRVGTLGVFDARARVESGMLCGKALDDRVGVALLVELARRLRGADLPWNTALLATAQEEFSVRGGVSAARRVDADVILCLDIAIATDTPDSADGGDVALGAGPVLSRFTRASLNGVIPHPKLRRFAESVAAERGIAVQDGVLQGGLTDASFMQHEGRGAAAIDLSFPTRYTHTPVETASLADIARLADWVEAVVRSLDGSPDLRRG